MKFVNSNKKIYSELSTVYIVLSVYNGEKYFLEQLMSIYFQEYKNRYLIIVDDGSTDTSCEIAENFIKNYNLSKKVKIIKQKNQGTCKAVERGLIEVQKTNKGNNLVALCDADDIWTRNKLEVQVEHMQKHKDCDLCFHDLMVIDENNNLKSTSLIRSKISSVNTNNNSFFNLCLGNYITTTEIVFRAKYINDIIPIENEGAKDYWTVLIFAIKKRNIHFVDKKLGFYRRGHTSIQKQLRSNGPIKSYIRDKEMLDLLKKRFPDEDEISYFIKFISDKIKWHKNKYSLRLRGLLILLNYPKIFFRTITNIVNNYTNFN